MSANSVPIDTKLILLKFRIPIRSHSKISAPIITLHHACAPLQPAVSAAAACAPVKIIIAVQPTSCTTLAAENSSEPRRPKESCTVSIALRPVCAPISPAR